MAGERVRLDAVHRAEAKRTATLASIAAQERALEAADREQTPAAQARRNRLRVRLSQLRDNLAAVERELLSLGHGATD